MQKTSDMTNNIFLYLLIVSRFLFLEAKENIIDFLLETGNRLNLFVTRWQHQFVPIFLILLGSIGTGSDWMGEENRRIRDELQANVSSHVTIDNYSQFAPLVAVYALDAFQIAHRCNLGEQIIVTTISIAMQESSVTFLKNTTHVQRPDLSAHNSFPSGHTTMAFVGAELLYQEYGATSSWIGIIGYLIAACTGFLRMYNNRHWLTDVVAGAGLGILIVRFAYWLLPRIMKKIREMKSQKIRCVSEKNM